MVLTPEQLKEVDQKGVEICEVARGRTLEQPAESRVTALLKFSGSSFKSGVSGEGRDSGDGESSLTLAIKAAAASPRTGAALCCFNNSSMATVFVSSSAATATALVMSGARSRHIKAEPEPPDLGGHAVIERCADPARTPFS